MKKIALFASGSGTNAAAIMEHFAGSDLAHAALVLSNRPDAYVLTRAGERGVPAETFSREVLYGDPQLILRILDRYGIDFIVLAGFMLLMPREIVEKYAGRIVNIHPALLPKYGGKGMYGDRVHRAVIAAGEKESGITIHYVNERYDEGDIISQYRLEVFPGETPDTLAERIHALEHRWYPQVIEQTIMKNEMI